MNIYDHWHEIEREKNVKIIVLTLLFDAPAIVFLYNNAAISFIERDLL